MLEQTGLGERRDDQVGTLSGGNQQRVNIAIGLLSVAGGAAPRRALDRARPAPARAPVGVRLGLAGTGTTVIYSTHHLHEAERYGDRLLVLADGERVFDGTPAELHAAVPETERERLRGGLRPLPARPGSLRCAGCCSRTCRSSAVRR